MSFGGTWRLARPSLWWSSPGTLAEPARTKLGHHHGWLRPRAVIWICGGNLPLVPGDSRHYVEVATSALRGEGPVNTMSRESSGITTESKRSGRTRRLGHAVGRVRASLASASRAWGRVARSTTARGHQVVQLSRELTRHCQRFTPSPDGDSVAGSRPGPWPYWRFCRSTQSTRDRAPESLVALMSILSCRDHD